MIRDWLPFTFRAKKNSLLQSELIDFYDQIPGKAQIETEAEQNDSDSTPHCL